MSDQNILKFYPFSEETTFFTPEPKPASKFVPDWYKKQRATIDEEQGIKVGAFNGTVKKCMPIFDIMTAGYMLTFPMDVYIDATNPEKLEISAPMPMQRFSTDMMASHAPEQYDEYPQETDIYHKQLFRVMPFWSVQTPPGYSTLVIHPQHQDALPFKTLGGFVDSDGFITDGHFSMFIRNNFKGIIKQGTPFAQLIPIKRESWEMELVDVKTSEPIIKRQRIRIRSTFKNGYKDKFRVPKFFK